MQAQHAESAPTSRIIPVLRRLLAITVILLAGVGGWFGAQRAVAAYRDNAVANPWPAELLVRDTTWESFQMTATDSSLSKMVWHDASVGHTKMIRSEGVAQTAVEITHSEVWQSTDAGTWTQGSDPSFARIDALTIGRPLHVNDLTPPHVERYTTVANRGDADSDGNRRFDVVIDGVAFNAASPIAYQNWSSATGIQGELASSAITVDVRSDGYVTRLASPASLDDSLEWSWTELDAPIVFESPISTDPAAAPAPATDGSGVVSNRPPLLNLPNAQLPEVAPWTYTETTITQDGEWRARRNFDADRGVVQDLDEGGAPKLEMTSRTGHRHPERGWPNFSTADPGMTASDIRGLYSSFTGQLVPPTLDEAVPPNVPFVTVGGEQSAEVGRRLTINVDQAGWAETDPATYQQWKSQMATFIGDGTQFAVVVDDSTGYLQSLGAPDSGVLWTWVQRSEPIALQSPIVLN